MKEKAAQGIVIVVKNANFISEEQEYRDLWENGLLGSENGEFLCHTLVWVFGMQFVFRAGQENRNLRFNNSQLSLQHDESDPEFFQVCILSPDVFTVLK